MSEICLYRARFVLDIQITGDLLMKFIDKISDNPEYFSHHHHPLDSIETNQ